MMHLPTLAERPDLFTITGLADAERATVDAVGDRYHVARRATDFRELLADAHTEAVLVLASGGHRKFVLPALEAGKHVFVEKPLGFSVAETEELARAAQRSGLRVMVGYHKRHDPAWQRARDEVRALGQGGQVHHLRDAAAAHHGHAEGAAHNPTFSRRNARLRTADWKGSGSRRPCASGTTSCSTMSQPS